MESEKIAVVLLNLGGPQNLDQVEDFLFSLFYDKTIINLPKPIRWLLAKLISKLRKKKSQKIYSLIGGKSPILEETTKQAKALEDLLLTEKDNFKVYICMRHAKPDIKDLEKEIKLYNPKKIVCIPMYPQFSYTTTYSAVEEIKNTFKDIEIKTIGCFYSCPNFINAQTELIKQALERVENISNTTIVFSAHSLPVRIIEQGDPYQSQIEKTVKLVMTSFSNIKHIITYQSKIGPVKWLTPNTKHIINKLNQEKQEIVVVPISFVSEHSETLVELDIDYKQIAKEANYIRVPTVGTNKNFITCLKNLVKISLERPKNITSFEGRRLCEDKFKYCICK